MAAVPVTVVGILTTESGSTNATLVGMASLTGLGVGGGPVTPPAYPAHPIAPGGEHPAHPIAPGGERPSHPIYWPAPPRPEQPIYLPPGIWPQPPDPNAPRPEHPIVIPPPPGTDGPPLEVKVVWTPVTGWAVILVPTVEHPAPA